jgi:hypothetical protein
MFLGCRGCGEAHLQTPAVAVPADAVQVVLMAAVAASGKFFETDGVSLGFVADSKPVVFPTLASASTAVARGRLLIDQVEVGSIARTLVLSLNTTSTHSIPCVGGLDSSQQHRC